MKSQLLRAHLSYFVLALLLAATQLGFAQAPNQPLNLANNFFVTGDYIVAGAYNMTSSFQTINGVTYAVGTIKVPDANSKGVQNPGIQGPTKVPTGAQVVAALLYWQTVEKVGAAGSGQNGYFRPLFTGGPAAPGYQISGTNVSGSKTVSWSSGGCGGTSTGKQLVTYRADIAGGMSVDASGNTVANGTFEVRLPSVGNSTPLTLGATLVVIYRLPAGAGGPNAPLNAIVIYDGDYSQNTAQLTMTQAMHVYDADHSSITKLTHIVGSGQSNKFQAVYLYNGMTAPKVPNPANQLPSLYGKQLPPFPGWYGAWDNPTWMLSSGTSPINDDSDTATTQVVPSMSNQGCVSWGAVIVSTGVKNGDDDGILDSWKLPKANPPGYCDYLTNSSCTGSQDVGWIPLPGATQGQKDIFLQYDYMCSTVKNPPSPGNGSSLITGDKSCSITGGDYSFDPRLAVDPADGKTAVEKVVDAFDNHKGSAKPFVLHAVPGNAIAESQSSCADTDVDAKGNLTCPFPNEPGTVGFREGLAYIKNQTISPQTGILGCVPTGANDPSCVAVLHHGKKDSYHYALFSHGVGLPGWFWSDGTISSVSQTGNTVTFTTSTPHNLAPVAGDTVCTAASGKIGRVTVIFAIANQNLNGTFCAKQATSPSPNKFAIVIPGSATTTTYTRISDPNLAVADGNVTSMSGYSDVGGQNSVISLGYGGWGPPKNLNPPSEGNKWNIKAGTFMHELGHTFALTHGGTFYNNYNPLALPPSNDYTPSFEVNCKPNVQSIMSYVFQFDLLQAPGPVAANQAPVKVLDYSEDPQSGKLINSLTENSPQPTGYLSGLTYPKTSWFQLGGTLPSSHCDGSPTLANEPSYVYKNDDVSNFSWSAANGTDINFNGNPNDPVMHPHNEWEGTPAQNGGGLSPGIDLQQVSVAGTITTIGPGGEAGGLHPAGGGGGLKPAGGGGGLHPAGGGGGLHPAGGGGGYKPAGGGGARAEITHGQANSYPRPPQNLFIQQEEASQRFIDLSWFAPSFGTAVQYNIYRADGAGGFALIDSVPGTKTMYQDKNVQCNLTGHHYQVTALINDDAGHQLESSPSNVVPASNEPLLTGCYTVSFSTFPNAIQGNDVSISWTLMDDFFIINPGDIWAHAAPNGVSTVSSAKLYVTGPGPSAACPNTPTSPTTKLLLGTITNGVAVASETGDTLGNSGDVYTFTWNNVNTDNLCSGSYTFELDLDSGQKVPSPATLQLGIDVGDQDTPRINTLSIPDATAYAAYAPPPLTEHGGVGTITWSISAGALPAGITLDPNTGSFSGFTTAAGTYNFTVKVTDSKGNSGTQAYTLVVHIFVSATAPVGTPPFTANPALPDAIVAAGYSQALTEKGGTPAFTWTLTGSFPTGISQQPVNSPNLSGTTCVVGSYNLNASVIDSNSNTGMQALTLQVDKGNATTSVASNANPSVFQQMVTFTVTVASAPASSCTPTGTVTLYIDGVQFGSPQALTNGTATFSTANLSVNTPVMPTHSITASYSGDTNFNSSNNNSTPLSQTVNKASTLIGINSVLPSPAFVGQPITVSFTFGVVAPGGGSPIGPSGNITVTASDGSSCVALPSLGVGACALSPAPAAAGNVAYAIAYAGDGNFVASGANGNYNVYQLVFTTQPSNTGVGNTITPAVAVTAEDSSSKTLTTFTGGITLAIGAGPGTLSGTPTQSAVAGVATFGDLSIKKIANGYTLIASPAGGVPDATSSAFNVDTFYVDSQGNFGTLDLATGTATQIGAATVPGSNGIDLTSGLQVYAYNSSNQLMQIAPSTGVATPIANPGSIPDQATTGALTDGSYFGIDAVTGDLYSINLATGATTLVGPTSTATALPTGCGFETSLAGLAGSPGVLYYTIGYSGASCTAPVSDTLYQIDPTTGTTTPIGPVTISGSPANGFVGSAFVGGKLYGFTSSGQEYTIDPATGAATFLVNTTPSTAIFGAGSQ